MEKDEISMNIERVCRVCLQETSEEGVSVTNFLEGYENVRISDAFTEITGYEILENEPQLICSRCVEMVTLSYELRLKAEVTQGLLSQNLTPKIETIHVKVELDDRFDHLEVDSDSDEDFKAFECSFCRKIHTSQAILNKHIKTFHPEELPFACNFCPKRFLSEKNFETHQKSCENKKSKQKLVCPVCGILASNDHIKNHSKSMEKEPSTTQNFICDLCGATTSSRASIANHMRFQHLHVQAKCKHCLATFKNPSALARHMRKSHFDKTREFRCRQCDFSSLREQDLRRHRRYHTGKKMSKCQICGAEFTTNCKLQTHLASHSDARPFTCETCGSAFKTKKALGAHNKTHKAYDYECPVCGRAYLTNQLMRNHAEKNHPEYQLPPPGTIFSKSWKLKMAEQKLKEMALQKGIKTEEISMQDLTQVQYYQPYFRT